MTRNTDDECQDKEEPSTAAEEIVEISDEVALLSDSSNTNSEDSAMMNATLRLQINQKLHLRVLKWENTIQSG